MSEKKNLNTGSAKPSSSFGLLGLASTMGMHMISGPLVGGAFGWGIDRWLDSSPWGLGIGVLLGIAAGFRNVWADAGRLRRGQEEIDARHAAEVEEAARKFKAEASGPRVVKQSFTVQKGEDVAPLQPDEDDFWLLDAPSKNPEADMSRLREEYRELTGELRQEGALPTEKEERKGAEEKKA